MFRLRKPGMRGGAACMFVAARLSGRFCEIHRLRRLRREPIGERLSRSWRLAHRFCNVERPQTYTPPLPSSRPSSHKTFLPPTHFPQNPCLHNNPYVILYSKGHPVHLTIPGSSIPASGIHEKGRRFICLNHYGYQPV